MGSYSTLYVDGKELCSRKHDLDQMIMTLFQPSERSIRRGKVKDIAPHLLEKDNENASEEVEILHYCTTVTVMKDRLELMGFSLSFVRKEFDAATKEQYEQFGDAEGKFGDRYPEASLEYKAKQRAVLQLSFDQYLTIFERLWRNKDELFQGDRPSVPKTDCSLDELLMWYVRTESFDTPYAFPSYDYRLFLRMVCEVLPGDIPVVYDLSDLIDDFGDAEGLASYSEENLDGGYATTRKIIVLTEGGTDQRAIKGTLSLLRPGLMNYFSFLDFDTMAVPGGVGNVVNTFKALVSVGITNRVVALLDNDTAAHSAVQSAITSALPSNARIVFLPRLVLAENYPTLGPSTGTTTIPMDINGFACSLELFFGEDILRRSSGDLVPIQWKGYDVKLKQYQGEITQKSELQSLFLKKLEQAREDQKLLDVQDWAPMKMVIQSLITAFHDAPPIDYGLETMESD